MRLGVDFGTTNSAIALYDGARLHTLRVDPANDNPYMLPSLLYIDRAGHMTVGAQAANLYLQKETGRPARWRMRDAGEITNTVASLDADEIEYTQQVHVLVDEGAHGRLIQSIKRALFNRRYEGTQVFSRFYRVDDLIAAVLRRLKTMAENQLGGAISEIVLGRPVQFSPNALVDSRAEAILLRAAHLAGFSRVQFELEPVGVAYLHHRDSAQRQTVLVFDFGGGTLDLTVARVGGPAAPEILATGGVQVGGDDLDRRIMESLLPHFGGGDSGRLSPEMQDKLLSWQTMPELSRPRQRERIRQLQRSAADPTPYQALETLVTHNIGFKLFKEIERVKIALSVEQSAVLSFNYQNIALNETLTRRRLERLIAGEIAAVERGVWDVLRRADVSAGSVDLVLRTGGSSLIPAFRALLGGIFSSERVRDIDPLVSVTGGFAVVAHDVPRRPAQDPARLIADARSSSGRAVLLHTLSVNGKVYHDWNFTFSRLPSALDGLAALQAANLDRELTDAEALRLRLLCPARVFVAYEMAVERAPDWLRQDFTPATLWLEISDDFALISRVMQVYYRDFPAGEVVLGGNLAAGSRGAPVTQYLLAVQPTG